MNAIEVDDVAWIADLVGGIAFGNAMIAAAGEFLVQTGGIESDDPLYFPSRNQMMLFRLRVRQARDARLRSMT